MTNLAPGWRKSSYCGTNACVEVLPLPCGGVMVRDSKDPGIAPLVFDAAEWRAFKLGVMAGEFGTQ